MEWTSVSQLENAAPAKIALVLQAKTFMTSLKKWQLLDSQLAFDHHWYTVRQDTVKLPNGNVVTDYFLSVRPDIAVVLPVTADNEIVFVRQYRHGAQEILLELPAGTFNPQTEQAELAAQRELREETGYWAENLERLTTLYDNPVKETNKIHLFLARNVQQVGEQILDPTEDIEVVLVPVPDIPQWLARGEMCVAGTVAALSLGLGAIAPG